MQAAAELDKVVKRHSLAAHAPLGGAVGAVVRARVTGNSHNTHCATDVVAAGLVGGGGCASREWPQAP